MSSVVMYVHGKGGSASEAEHYRALFPRAEVYGFDYRSVCPWDAKAEFAQKAEELKASHDGVILVAVSIGAYFSMSAGLSDAVSRAYFISPVVDMERLIADMMSWASVTEETLEREKIIRTDWGEELSWDYLQYVRRHPIVWNAPTEILYGGADHLQSMETIRAFAGRCGAGVTVMADGEHWFHTPEQMKFLDDWIGRLEAFRLQTHGGRRPER